MRRALSPRLSRARGVALLVLVLGSAAACGRSGSGARSADTGSFRSAGVGAFVDPTVRPARLLPETVEERESFGAEPGGGTRALLAGIRIVTSQGGAVTAAEERLPQAPLSTTVLPERLGGGFLFVLDKAGSGSTVWRAEKWLGPVSPLFTSPTTVQAVLPGLDRVYLRTAQTTIAIDGKSGKPLDLGPWPPGPFVTAFGAADGWRAAAVTDLRGAVATFDAGATWRALDIPIDAKQVVVSGESLAIGGLENGRAEVWFELRPDGSVSRLGAPPREARDRIQPLPPSRYPTGAYSGYYPGVPPVPTYAPRPPSSAVATAVPSPATPAGSTEETPAESAAKIFGKRPLAAAIEDGWPLTDGTAVVARDGALARVRLSDGALVELAQDAFPLKPARCHPVSLTRATSEGAFGFVCGEPRGTTVIYAYEPMRGRLAELKRFDKPRVVASSGNGALAVRGACAADAEPPAPLAPEPVKLEKEKGDKDKNDKDANGKSSPRDKSDDKDKPEAKADKSTAPPRPTGPTIHPYCVLAHDNVWREVHVRGDVAGERVVVLADGKLAVLSPSASQSAPARLTILDKGQATTVALAFPKVNSDVARVLRLGLWLDGFEERRPGVLGGWIEAGGSMLGIEIALDGRATLGQYIRDAGMPFVSGRYGLGWTASRRGYETTDGGMTWSSMDVPDPLVPVAKVTRRACGPIGCVAGGWLRVGWGEVSHAAAKEAPPAYRPSASVLPATLALSCEPTAPEPPEMRATPKTQAPARPSTPKPPAAGIHRTYGGSPVLGSAYEGLTELPAFYAQPAPTFKDPDRGLTCDANDVPDRSPPMQRLGRLYAWGPKTGEWDTQGKWQVKWLSPFAGWPEVRASAPALPPPSIVDLARHSPYSYGYSSHYYGALGNCYGTTLSIATGDDPSHALLVMKRNGQTGLALYELEADRAPIELRRADGEPWNDVESAVRTAGRWFVSTPSANGTSGIASTIWQADGTIARELLRIPRNAPTEAKLRLARRSDGRALGLVVDGQAPSDRNVTTRWVVPVDVESGQLGEPESLGFTDLAGRTLDACTDDLLGWVFDGALPSTARVKLPGGNGGLHSVYARTRLTSTRACVERIAGTFDQPASTAAKELSRAGAPRIAQPSPPRPGELLVSAMTGQVRFPLRCSVAK